MAHLVREDRADFLLVQVCQEAGGHRHHGVVLGRPCRKRVRVRCVEDPDLRHLNVQPLGELPNGLEDHFLLAGLGLGDLVAVQHGSGELLGEGQRDEGAAEAEDAGIEQHVLVDGPADIDAEGRQDDIGQDLEYDIQCDGDEQVRNQQQPDPLQLLKHLISSSFTCGVKGPHAYLIMLPLQGPVSRPFVSIFLTGADWKSTKLSNGYAGQPTDCFADAP